MGVLVSTVAATRSVYGFAGGLLVLMVALSASASTRTWVGGSAGNNWFEPANWDPGNNYPQNGETVAIPSGKTVFLTNETAELASFSITNSTLTFSNWNTRLRATTVVIENGATITLPPAFTETQMSNRVYFVGGDFTLNAGATINTDFRGYRPHNGPGAGTTGRAGDGYGSPGAGYGGRGGQASAWLAQTQGVVYGSTHAPLDPGSGGGSTNWVSEGGGAVRIDAAGRVLIHGTISANGRDFSNGGSGSGGSIYITCDTFGGDATGLLRANGGGGGGGADGVGGGGRIAVHYASGLYGAPRVRLSANRGIWLAPATDHLSVAHPTDLHRYRGSMGTLSFPDGRLLDSLLSAGTVTDLYGYVHLQSGTVWTSAAPSTLTITNSLLGIPENSGWELGQDLLLAGGGIVAEYGSMLQTAGNLTLTNGGTLTVYSAPTNETTASYGVLVDVAGSLSVASGGWIFPYSDPTNGGSAFFDVGTLTILNGGGFNANGRGFTRDAGPGKGQPFYAQGGGGYGGRGGHTGTEAYAGPVYGSTNAPMHPGSGGGSYGLAPGDTSYRGGFGGGLVRIEVAGEWTHEGAILAVGTNSHTAASAGSGGGIYVSCGFLSSATTAILNAGGGNGASGVTSAGGGGRIAVWIGVPENRRNDYLAGDTNGVHTASTLEDFPGMVSVTGGTAVYNLPDERGAHHGTVRLFTYRDPAAPLGVTVAAATGIGVTNATLRGRVDGLGDAENPDLYFCWGTTDPGVSATGLWAHVVAIGNAWGPGESFSREIFNFNKGQLHVYRVYAVNSSGAAWSPPAYFTTFGDPVVIQRGAVNVGSSTATLRGEVTDTGGATTVAGFEYWRIGGATERVSLGTQSGGFETLITGLERNQSYAFRAWAENAPGGSGYSGIHYFQTIDRESRAFTWDGAANADWFNSANWQVNVGEPGTPEDGDTVAIPGGKTVLLNGQTPFLLSFSITNSTLTLSNWNTRLRATTVTIDSGTIITLPAAFTETQMSNRVHFVGGDFTLNAGATINADFRGYRPHNGPGTGTKGRAGDGYGSPGAGYGGRGGQASSWLLEKQGKIYGSTHAPLDPGSGGGSTNWVSEGGGAVRIDAAGRVLIHGTISANGRDVSNGGSGSGGSIYITCDTFGGDATGLLRANGGGGGGGADGVGGGGRIAVHYASGLYGAPRVRLSANRGIWLAPTTDNLSIAHPTDLHRYRGSMGTLSFPDGRLLDSLLSAGTVTDLYGYVHLQSGSVWTSAAASALTITDSLLGIPENGGWELGQDLVLAGGGIVAEYGSVLQSSANMTLANGGTLTVYSAPTNETTASYGALVEVSGSLTVAANGWVFPYSDPTNGGSVFFDVGALTILNGGGFNANGRGFTRDAGPGKGQPFHAEGGGGYGGRGGHQGNEARAGRVYGATNAPMQPGSGGGSYGLSPGDTGYRGGFGGGLVRIEVAGAWIHEGAILAVGTNSHTAASAGSGGGIHVTCRTLSSTETSVLKASGGNGMGDISSGGGGGRIALWIKVPKEIRQRYSTMGDTRWLDFAGTHDAYSGQLSVEPGTGTYNVPDPLGAEPGTVSFVTSGYASGMLLILQ